MDIKAFDTDWIQGVLGVLALIVVLAMVLERALSMVFEWGVWDKFLADKSLRAPIALIASYVICAYMQLDILLTIGKKDPSMFRIFSIGTFLTAATIAGGSKGAITLFQNVLNFSKGGTVAEKEVQKARRAASA
jgi:uncharacterized BrkB/YihY/UPF0761 family membrane protein